MVETGDKKWGRRRARRGMQGKIVTRKRDSEVTDKKRRGEGARSCFFSLFRQAEISTNQIVACRQIGPNRRCHGRIHIKSCLIG